MKLGSLASSRPSYWDRNPVRASGGYYNVVGPHAPTTRFTITNTASQKLFIDAGSLSAIRMTAAGALGLASCTLDQPLGYAVVWMAIYNNTVGFTTERSLSGSILVLPGDSISGTTYDSSTGGTVQYVMYVHGVTFDA